MATPGMFGSKSVLCDAWSSTMRVPFFPSVQPLCTCGSSNSDRQYGSMPVPASVVCLMLSGWTNQRAHR